MKKIVILNGPNINLTGIREPHIYGSESATEHLETLKKRYEGKAEITVLQTNHEGTLVDWVQQYGFGCDGIVLNAGAYAHTSIALRDAIAAVEAEVVETHISNIFAREEFRHKSVISAACKGVICGFGLHSYDLATDYLVNK